MTNATMPDTDNAIRESEARGIRRLAETYVSEWGDRFGLYGNPAQPYAERNLEAYARDCARHWFSDYGATERPNHAQAIVDLAHQLIDERRAEEAERIAAGYVCADCGGLGITPLDDRLFCAPHAYDRMVANAYGR